MFWNKKVEDPKCSKGQFEKLREAHNIITEAFAEKPIRFKWTGDNFDEVCLLRYCGLSDIQVSFNNLLFKVNGIEMIVRKGDSLELTAEGMHFD